MIKKTFFAALLPCILLLGGTAGAAQDKAAKLSTPLTIVVGYAPGGATDRAARIVATSLQDKLGVSVVVENKTGAGGRIAAQHVKNDGTNENVLLLCNSAMKGVVLQVSESLAYEAFKDF